MIPNTFKEELVSYLSPVIESFYIEDKYLLSIKELKRHKLGAGFSKKDACLPKFEGQCLLHHHN